VQSVSNCGRITDEGVRSLCTSTAISENLTVLELDSCMQITDECLTHITACQRLERLEVFDNRQITRPAIEHYMVSATSSFLPFLSYCPYYKMHETISCTTSSNRHTVDLQPWLVSGRGLGNQQSHMGPCVEQYPRCMGFRQKIQHMWCILLSARSCTFIEKMLIVQKWNMHAHKFDQFLTMFCNSVYVCDKSEKPFAEDVANCVYFKPLSLVGTTSHKEFRCPH